MEGQLSIFDWMPETKPVQEPSKIQIIEEREVLKGSGFKDGKTRIYNYFKEGHTEKECVTFLKNEYGVGGWTIDEGYYGHDANGIDINFRKKPIGKTVELHIGWPMVVKIINRLIEEGKYKPDKSDEYYYVCPDGKWDKKCAGCENWFFSTDGARCRHITCTDNDYSDYVPMIKSKAVCEHSNHECNMKNLWEVADTLDDIKCKHVCCRECDVKGCGVRCDGSEEPHKSLRTEYDLPVPKDTKWDERGYCDVWHYIDEELPSKGDIFWTYARSGSVPLFGYSAYFKNKWWRWHEWEHKWSYELGRVEIIAYMQIPTIQRHKDKSLQEMFGLEGIVSEGSKVK